VRTLITGMPLPYDVAAGDPRVCGVIVECNPETGRATAIERINVPVETPMPADEPE
jgi:2',3'-cyclic-nucleotide 2'-phosphodiesterase